MKNVVAMTKEDIDLIENLAKQIVHLAKILETFMNQQEVKSQEYETQLARWSRDLA